MPFLSLKKRPSFLLWRSSARHPDTEPVTESDSDEPEQELEHSLSLEFGTLNPYFASSTTQCSPPLDSFQVLEVHEPPTKTKSVPWGRASIFSIASLTPCALTPPLTPPASSTSASSSSETLVPATPRTPLIESQPPIPFPVESLGTDADADECWPSKFEPLLARSLHPSTSTSTTPKPTPLAKRNRVRSSIRLHPSPQNPQLLRHRHTIHFAQSTSVIAMTDSSFPPPPFAAPPIPPIPPVIARPRAVSRDNKFRPPRSRFVSGEDGKITRSSSLHLTQSG